MILVFRILISLSCISKLYTYKWVITKRKNYLKNDCGSCGSKKKWSVSSNNIFHAKITTVIK